MARLNEPPVSTDTIEMLRKKFLRQNRDIARINSHQSLRIRQLENECARLLSENLEVRTRNLELEKQVEDNSARRIADHALEIKAKMEAQLAQWGDLLAGLGVEPPTKRRMHGDRKIEKPKLATGRSPAQRRPRNVAQDDEAQAMQEGRLPPIHENKTYPRQTLNGEEILALCSEADTSNDSPDLGPPPVSRFVEEDPVKIDSPCKATSIPGEATIHVDDAPSLALPEKGPIRLDYNKTVTEPRKAASDAVPAPDAARPPLKAGSKRKFALKDEDDCTSSTISHTPRVTKEIKPLAVRDIKSRKAIREMAVARQDAKDKPTTAPILAASARKPLAAKSTNDDVSSPKKMAKAATQDPVAAAKLDIAKEAAKEKKRVAPVPIPAPAPPRTVTIVPEPVTASPDTAVACPNTPEPPRAKDSAGDTPPPTDISAQGELSRPGRRAKPSISYAEPNLRDKMRRPTKELVDAVSGEGKYIRRTSTTHQIAPLSSAKAEHDAESAEAWKDLPTKEAAIAHESSRRESVLSPLAEKNDSARALPTAVTTDKKKRASIARDVSGIADPDKDASTSEGQEPNEAEEIVVGHGKEHDPYEFTSTSPVSESKLPQPALPRKPASHRAPKGSRRSTAALRDEHAPAKDERPARHAGARKRASMAAPKTTSMYDFEDPEDSPFESSMESGGGGGKPGADAAISARDRGSRRRSMML